jgi:hypothetical protein
LILATFLLAFDEGLVCMEGGFFLAWIVLEENSFFSATRNCGVFAGAFASFLAPALGGKTFMLVLGGL